MPNSADNTIHASPAKAFFVDMITRDIELQDALLDLLDNCVDGVRRMKKVSGSRPFKGYYAHITFDEKRFVIEDNCGGISLDIAKKYAFMMGKPEKYQNAKDGTIGVYGIGMKRAIFKMGRSCVVHSHTKGDTFEVEITKAWLADDQNWDLEARPCKSTLDEFGTRIVVSDLRPVIKAEFTQGSDFSKKFIAVVRDAYSLLIAKGFQVKINNEVVSEKLPKLLWDTTSRESSLQPYVYRAEFEDVNVFVVVGFRGKPQTEINEQEESVDAHYSSEDAGWTIICNDRVVLPYNKGKETGWGWGGVPKYHTQFIAIGGFVIFEGNPASLPMTTTKRGVDGNSHIYMTVRERMQQGITHFTKFTNDWKGVDVSKFFKNAEEYELPQIQKEVDARLKLRSIKGEIDQKHSIPHLPERPKAVLERRISYLRHADEIRKVSMFLFETEDRKPSEVGAGCFDFVLKKSA